MRILTLTDYFFPYGAGGVERVVLEVGRALARRQVEVAVLTLSHNGALGSETLDGMRVYRAKAIDLTRVLGFQCSVSPSLYRRALDVAATFRPDVIHTHNIFFMASLVAPLIKRALNLPLVTTIHLGSLAALPPPGGWLARVYEAVAGRWILRNSDLVLAVSESVRTHGRDLGVPDDKIVTVSNAVDIPRIRAGERMKDMRRVVFVGRLIVNKGPHLFVEAARRVLPFFDNVRFDLVGDGPMRRRLEDTVTRRGLEARVRFWGFREDVQNFLNSATIFVRPSFSEGLPLTVLEAMAHGVPVIASRLAGTVDVVKDGETGILVEPGDVAALTDAIMLLLRDEGKRRALAGNARSLVESYYGWDRVAAEILAHYERLLAGRERIAEHTGGAGGRIHAPS
jgi:glycosyltransferase involved in cell wall biosynthesis